MKQSDSVNEQGEAILRRISRAPRITYCSAVNLLYQKGILSTRDLTLPHFLGIGVQKAGSTWLFENLQRHPDLFLPDSKELKYFSRRFHESLSGYSRNFAEAKGKVIGDLCTSYSLLPQSRIRFIRRVMPEVRILVVLRNPLERAWSFANMQLVRDPNRRFEDVTEAEFIAHLRSEKSWKHSDYRGLLERWLRVFPEDQLWIGFFEDISGQPQAFLTEVFDFLGVRTAVDWDAFPYRTVINPGPRPPIPERFRGTLEELYEPTLDWLRRRFGERVNRWTVEPVGLH